MLFVDQYFDQMSDTDSHFFESLHFYRRYNTLYVPDNRGYSGRDPNKKTNDMWQVIEYHFKIFVDFNRVLRIVAYMELANCLVYCDVYVVNKFSDVFKVPGGEEMY